MRVRKLVDRRTWSRRYAAINRLRGASSPPSGTVIVKCFLHISPEEQLERLLARLDDPTKHWKYNPGDLEDRALLGRVPARLRRRDRALQHRRGALVRHPRRPQVVPQLGDHPAADPAARGAGARLAGGRLRRRRAENAAALGARLTAPFRPYAVPVVPRTRYARRGDTAIAYQVHGDGPIDLVFLAGVISHIEHLWEEPSLARLLDRQAEYSRLILMDRRGTGLSDPLGGPLALADEVDDLIAVLDAVGSDRAALHAYTRRLAVRDPVRPQAPRADGRADPLRRLRTHHPQRRPALARHAGGARRAHAQLIDDLGRRLARRRSRAERRRRRAAARLARAAAAAVGQPGRDGDAHAQRSATSTYATCWAACASPRSCCTAAATA